VDVRNEYGMLKNTIMGSVANYFDHEPINKTQEKFFKDSRPDKNKMVDEQKTFADILKDYSVEIMWADSLEDCPLQVHTRDVSFAIGNKLVISEMRSPIRKNERKGLKNILDKIETPTVDAHEGCVEGGDVLVDGKCIYVGLGQRTDAGALSWITSEFGNDHEIIPIRLKPGILHLDTVFNILSKRRAMIFEKGIAEDDVLLLKERFDTFNLSEDEQFNMGTNVLSINPDVVVAQPSNERSVKDLKALGLTVETVDYREIAKLGGGFRCGTCPLLRM
jgi:N-dimethylarginine dimethylaminohydrolase